MYLARIIYWIGMIAAAMGMFFALSDGRYLFAAFTAFLGAMNYASLLIHKRMFGD